MKTLLIAMILTAVTASASLAEQRYVYVVQGKVCVNGVCTQQVVAFAVPDDKPKTAPATPPKAAPQPMPGPGVTTVVEKSKTKVVDGRHPVRRTFGAVGRFFLFWR